MSELYQCKIIIINNKKYNVRDQCIADTAYVTLQGKKNGVWGMSDAIYLYILLLKSSLYLAYLLKTSILCV